MDQQWSSLFIFSTLYGTNNKNWHFPVINLLFKTCLPLLIESYHNWSPTFLQVETEFGLSNYIPVLIADKDVCAEMEIIHQKCVQTLYSKSSACESDKCDFYEQRHATLSEFVLDIAWLLKKPTESFQDYLTSSQIATYVSVLNYLMHNDSDAILDRVLKSLSIRISSAENSNPGYTTCENGIRLLRKKMDQASNILRRKHSGITSITQKSLPNKMLKTSTILNEVSTNKISAFPYNCWFLNRVGIWKSFISSYPNATIHYILISAGYTTERRAQDYFTGGFNLHGQSRNSSVVTYG